MTTEERFIIGLYNQEEQSLVDLYDCYFTLLWSISFRVVADKAICEEVLRQVFQDAWTNPSDFNNGKKLSSLLIGCCLSKLDLLTLQNSS